MPVVFAADVPCWVVELAGERLGCAPTYWEAALAASGWWQECPGVAGAPSVQYADRRCLLLVCVRCRLPWSDDEGVARHVLCADEGITGAGLDGWWVDVCPSCVDMPHT